RNLVDAVRRVRSSGCACVGEEAEAIEVLIARRVTCPAAVKSRAEVPDGDESCQTVAEAERAGKSRVDDGPTRGHVHVDRHRIADEIHRHRPEIPGAKSRAAVPLVQRQTAARGRGTQIGGRWRAYQK